MYHSVPPPQPTPNPRMRLLVPGLIILAGVGVLLAAIGIAAAPLPATVPAATLPHTATPVPYRGLGDTATLGGTLLGFDQRFGAPIHQANYVVTVAGVPVTILAVRDAATSHIISLDIAPQGSWTAAQAMKIALAFLPADAKHVRDFTLAPAPHAVEHVYQSAALAATFPASAFINVNTDAVESPGTLSYVCIVGVANKCNVGIGTD